MKNIHYIYPVLLLLLVSSFSSCEVIGGIFKAGMGFGIFIVVAIIAVIALIVGRIGSRK
ncbi:MAG TPA: hypothetical protein VL092_08560 [Chitinophagaceae bacterium]|nr:hypothetical protein [Chitinophagaceae bacterium]